MKNLLIIIQLAASALVIAVCNPVSENVSEQTWTSIHSSLPFNSSYYHGANYRFPVGSCDQPQCHGAGLSGGNSGGPSCLTCHADLWTIFSTTHTFRRGGYYHHNAVDAAADTSSNLTWFGTAGSPGTGCKNTSCHGSTLDGVIGAGRSCKVCHSSFGGTGLIPPPGHTSNREGARHKSGSSCGGDACHGTGSGDNYTGGTTATEFTGIAGKGPACSVCH